jgi:membrane-associated protease RseP (regulator of RpoE activity)
MYATALNLLPSSQLDGGHIVYALAPRMHRAISWITAVVLLYLARRHVSWGVWAGVVIVMNVLTYRQQQAPAYPALPATRWALALLAAIMLVLTFTIAPLQMSW